MRRLWRIFRRGAAALSLLLALAFGCLWLRSYWKTDGCTRSNYLPAGHELRAYSFGSQQGRAGFILLRLWFDPAKVKTKEEGSGGTVYIPALMGFGYKNEWSAVQLDLSTPSPQRWWERMGVSVRKTGEPGLPVAISQTSVIVPYWMLVLLFAIWPALWMLSWWRRKRKLAAGLCVHCGYDLRATLGRCPECGSSAPSVL